MSEALMHIIYREFAAGYIDSKIHSLRLTSEVCA